MEPGGLSLKRFVGDDGIAEVSTQTPCESHLSCGRNEASTSTAMTVHAVGGGACGHGVPLAGTFVDMKTAEQYIYYLVIIQFLLSSGSAGKFSDLYIDFGCRFKKTFARYIERNGSHLAPLGATSVRIMVNWMHGASHNLACQLLNNGRYAQGAGHVDGEDMERLFKWLKVRVRLGFGRCLSLLHC